MPFLLWSMAAMNSSSDHRVCTPMWLISQLNICRKHRNNACVLYFGNANSLYCLKLDIWHTARFCIWHCGLAAEWAIQPNVLFPLPKYKILFLSTDIMSHLYPWPGGILPPNLHFIYCNPNRAPQQIGFAPKEVATS
jgi:hypothetical protein